MAANLTPGRRMLTLRTTNTQWRSKKYDMKAVAVIHYTKLVN